MKKTLCKKIADILENISCEQLEALMEIPTDEKMGDYAIPCFSLAGIYRKKPAIIAEDILSAIIPHLSDLGLEKAEQVGGYCNLFCNKIAFIQTGLKELQQNTQKVTQIGNGKTICIDYSSPNIAKNFHVGHLRTTVIGNSLSNIFSHLGYRVVRINYLGDWGTQFGKLITAYKKWSSREAVEANGIEELLRIYVKFNTEAKCSPELMEDARSWFIKMEQNNEEAISIWNWFKEISMAEFERIYQLLGISFDSYSGESCYRDKVPALMQELKRKNLLTESQGAMVINLEPYGMPPCLITKRDGGSIYPSRDIAALLDRMATYHFDKCLYVTGLEQSLHFKQVFKVIELMHYPWYDRLIHVPFGLVSLDGEKLSTRSGNVIYAEDILNEAIQRALDQIREKNPSLPNKKAIARHVGVGAVIFHDLYHQRIKNVDFSWKEVLNFEGATGPYVQYTYARAKSILRKSGDILKHDSVHYEFLTDNTTMALLKILFGYPQVLLTAAEKYEPSVISRYLISLTIAFNRFYHECPILRAPVSEKNARLKVVDLTQQTIKDACGLLGIQCPEEM